MTCPAVLCLKWWQSDNVSHEVMLSFSSADGSCVSSCRTVSWNRYTGQRASEWHGWTGGWNTTRSTLLDFFNIAGHCHGPRFWVWSQSRMKSLLFCFNESYSRATHRGVVVIPAWGSKPYMVQAVMKTKIMTQPQIGDSTACTESAVERRRRHLRSWDLCLPSPVKEEDQSCYQVVDGRWPTSASQSATQSTPRTWAAWCSDQ